MGEEGNIKWHLLIMGVKERDTRRRRRNMVMIGSKEKEVDKDKDAVVIMRVNERKN